MCFIKILTVLTAGDSRQLTIEDMRGGGSMAGGRSPLSCVLIVLVMMSSWNVGIGFLSPACLVSPVRIRSCAPGRGDRRTSLPEGPRRIGQPCSRYSWWWWRLRGSQTPETVPWQVWNIFHISNHRLLIIRAVIIIIIFYM